MLKQPDNVVMSALIHCVTGEAGKTIDSTIKPESEHNIQSVLLLRGKLKKGRDSTRENQVYVPSDLLLFAVMNACECSGKQATNRLATIFRKYNEAMAAIQAIKDDCKLNGRQPNAAEKRTTDDLLRNIFGMDKDDINTNLKRIFEPGECQIPGRINAEVTVEELDAEISTKIIGSISSGRRPF